MRVALVTTHTARTDHLAVRSPDPSPTWNPLCGQTFPGRIHVLEWRPGGAGNGVRKKPLCNTCAARLADLVELAGRRQQNTH